MLFNTDSFLGISNAENLTVVPGYDGFFATLAKNDLFSDATVDVPDQDIVSCNSHKPLFWLYGNFTNFFGAICMKFRGIVSGGARLFVDDVVRYRYADSNKIRIRAHGQNYPSHIFVSGSKEDNDAAILNERVLELTLEGKRWWDIVRFGKPFEMVPAFAGKPDFVLLFPLSLNTLSLEPKIQQNPGYWASGAFLNNI